MKYSYIDPKTVFTNLSTGIKARGRPKALCYALSLKEGVFCLVHVSCAGLLHCLYHASMRIKKFKGKNQTQIRYNEVSHNREYHIWRHISF